MLKNDIPFQGNTHWKNYFEGWYFKQVSADLSSVYSFIPGISLGENKHAFIQALNGITGESHYLEFPLESCVLDKKKLNIRIGENNFSEEGLTLNLNTKNLIIKGSLRFGSFKKVPRSLLQPSIMGWYAYVPKMECKHGLVSLNHQLKGSLNIQSKEINFSGGKGYIEKDYGSSFPESWIWLQSNHFKSEEASFFISIAKIPWMGSFFIGHLCILQIAGKCYNFSKYTGAKIQKLSYNKPLLEIHVSTKNYKLEILASYKKDGNLQAPVSGDMNRRIKESIDSEVKVKLYDKKKNTIVFQEQGDRAGLEIMDAIFDYFT